MPILTTPVNRAIPLKQPFIYNKKVVYLDDNGDEVDITDYALIVNFERRSLRYGIGAFTILLNNNNGQYLNVMNEDIIIIIYADNGSAIPSNKVFRGRIDNSLYSLDPDNSHFKIIIGRDWPEIEGEIMSIPFSEAQAKDCFSSIVSQKFPTLLTTTNVSANMTTSINYNFIDDKPSGIFSDILKKANHDGYIDHDADIHTFEVGSNINNNEVVSYGVNLLPYDNFGKDNLNSYNKIKGYGAQNEGLFLVRTKSNSNVVYVKAKTISEGTLDKITDLDEEVQSELDFSAAIIKGSIPVSNGLFSLQPGQSIRITDQFSGISGYYTIPIFSMQFNQDGSCFTTLTIEKPNPSDASDFLKLEKDLKNITINNPNTIDDTIFLFNFEDTTDINSLGDCELSNNKLVLKSGISTGIMESVNKTLSKEPSKYFFQVKGNQLDISTIRVSMDNALTFNDSVNIEQFKNTKISLSKTGKKPVVEITLKSDGTYDNPQLEAFGLSVEY